MGWGVVASLATPAWLLTCVPDTALESRNADALRHSPDADSDKDVSDSDRDSDGDSDGHSDGDGDSDSDESDSDDDNNPSLAKDVRDNTSANAVQDEEEEKEQEQAPTGSPPVAPPPTPGSLTEFTESKKKHVRKPSKPRQSPKDVGDIMQDLRKKAKERRKKMGMED